MTLLAEYDYEISKDIKDIGKKVAVFYSDLIKASPVASIKTSGYVGGDFKGAWELIKVDELSWTIKNPQSYAEVLWRGRRIGRNFTTIYGSTQWADGGEPMLAKFKEELRV